MELTIKLYSKSLVSKVPHILKLFYDLDILEEKVILEWGEKAYKKTVGKELAEEIHSKAAPFLKWLKEAEEDSSEEDDDAEDEVDVDFNDRVIATKIQAVDADVPSPKKALEKSNIIPTSVAAAAQPDDIDIDAI